MTKGEKQPRPVVGRAGPGWTEAGELEGDAAGKSGFVTDWINPRAAFAALLARNPSEGQAFFWLLGGALASLVADLPALLSASGSAAPSDLPLAGVMAARLLAAVLFVPLAFYLFAALMHLSLRILGWRTEGKGLRVVLFRALWLTAPLVILRGWIAHFLPVAAGPLPSLISGVVLWLAFLWLLIGGLAALRDQSNR